jgi:two-component system chemotaxis sensor kinase CheA
MLTDDDIRVQVLAAFQEEQVEHRQAIGDLLLQLERSPDHPQRPTLLNELFRQAHSLKGGARAAGVIVVEEVAHLLEDLFSAVRQGRLALAADVCDRIYEALDAIGQLMREVAADQPATLAPYQPLLAALTQIRDAHAAKPALVHQHGYPPGAAAPLPESTSNGVASAAESTSGASDAQTTVRLSTTVLDTLMQETGELLTCAVGARQRTRELRTIAELPARWRRTWRQVRPAITRLKSGASAHRPIVHYLYNSAVSPERAPELQTSDYETLRLIDALEQANTLISELDQQLSAYARVLIDDSTRLGAATERLHRQIRRTRMLSVATLFIPMRLQLREMARTAGKQVDLSLEDGGAEADRQVLDRLREVLMHLLRNAVDHGIEAPEQRVAAGKPDSGQITLGAVVSGEHLTLTIADDGAGLNYEQIRQRAHANGLLTEAELLRASEAELAELIFAPGLTTRETVSVLSGRGVGLDIVRAQVERMHGRVSVRSTAGSGCCFTITVPVSLTTAHCLLIRAGAVTYALPLDAIQQIVMVGPHDIQMLEGQTALVVDGRPLLLTHLTDILGQGRGAVRAEGRMLGLRLGSGERQAVCMVDAVLGEQELIMQRLPAPLQQVPLIAGATILADGSIVTVLDSVDLLRAAFSIRQSTDTVPAEAEQTASQARTILVVDDSITTRTLEKNILEAVGYRVCLATDGVEALEKLEQLSEDGGCDLLLSDVDMPRLNGFELTSAVRSDQRFRHMPVVLVTSLDTPADHERGIAAGADSYIVKRAFDQQILLDTIARLI